MQTKITENQHGETVETVTDVSVTNPEVPVVKPMLHSSFHGPPVPKSSQLHSDSVAASEKVAKQLIVKLHISTVAKWLCMLLMQGT